MHITEKCNALTPEPRSHVERKGGKKRSKTFWIDMKSILPTFYEHICTNILAQIKSLTFTASIKKLCAKLSYEKAARKMLVKLTHGRLKKNKYRIYTCV